MLREGWDRHAWYAELYAELREADDLARWRAASKKRREGSLRYKSRAGGRQGAEVAACAVGAWGNVSVFCL